MLTVMTMERLMTIMYPLKFGHMRLKHARLVTSAGWFVSIVLSAVPTFRLPYFGDAFFGSTGIARNNRKLQLRCARKGYPETQCIRNYTWTHIQIHMSYSQMYPREN